MRKTLLALALALPLGLGGCADWFNPVSDESLELLKQATTEYKVKQEAVDPAARYEAVMGDLELLLDFAIANPGAVSRDQLLLLEAVKTRLRDARLRLFAAIRRQPPDPVGAAQAKTELALGIQFLEAELGKFASKIGG